MAGKQLTTDNLTVSCKTAYSSLTSLLDRIKMPNVSRETAPESLTVSVDVPWGLYCFKCQKSAKVTACGSATATAEQLKVSSLHFTVNCFKCFCFFFNIKIKQVSPRCTAPQAGF